MNPTSLRWLPVVVLLGLAAGPWSLGCTNGTTPVCDDGGSCLLSPGDAGGAPSGDGGDGGGDAAAE